MRKDRVSTGIRELDVILEGGYKNPATVLLTGPPGDEKNAFAFHFAEEGLQNKEVILYITLEHTPKEIIKIASEYGIELKGNNLFFMDCYSSTINAPVNKGENAVRINGPSALNDISLEVNEFIKKNKEKKIRVIFHTFSSLALYNEHNSLFKFFKVIEGRLKQAGATLFLIVDEGMHEKKFINTLEHSVDQIFKYGLIEGEKQLSSAEIPISLKVKIGAAGVDLE